MSLPQTRFSVSRFFSQTHNQSLDFIIHCWKILDNLDFHFIMKYANEIRSMKISF